MKKFPASCTVILGVYRRGCIVLCRVRCSLLSCRLWCSWQEYRLCIYCRRPNLLSLEPAPLPTRKAPESPMQWCYRGILRPTVSSGDTAGGKGHSSAVPPEDWGHFCLFIVLSKSQAHLSWAGLLCCGLHVEGLLAASVQRPPSGHNIGTAIPIWPPYPVGAAVVMTMTAGRRLGVRWRGRDCHF